jgi:hypothetical protein
MLGHDARFHGAPEGSVTGPLGRGLVEAAFLAVATTALLAIGRRDAGSQRARAARPAVGGAAISLVLAGVTLAAAAGLVFVLGPGGGSTGTASASLLRVQLPGELVTRAPWPANVALLRGRLDALGLPALGREGTALHTHQHLDLFVRGRRVVVPGGIGIDAAARFISPIHTHDASGVIHVESPQVRTFTLGQLFGVWGVRLTRTCLGGYCARGRDRLVVYADGRRVTGDPRVLPLAPHAEIVVAYGTRAELPRQVPTAYAFPAGL